ncbi:kelch domain-containing protein 7A [Oxyura jamaicensis]|uniref:kelch domain-containing protein 7A n=1 Tax=Oxyura jamaicensis TaxID=8884 RepID=UPI0015A6CC2E|nr:kelch domain-containing protein 7A [Oxyura jamaicensis]
MSQRVTVPWQSDMQLAGKLVLSAAALLLLTLAYRLYKARSAPGSPGGSTLAADARGETERRENAAQDGEAVAGLRRRQVFGGGAWQGGGDARVSALEPRQVLARRDQCLPVGKEEEKGEPGGEPEFFSSGDLAEMLSGEEGSRHGRGVLSPCTELSTQMGDDGGAQSTEQDLGIGGRSQEGSRGVIQTRSVTSDLGLMITASNKRSDTSYSFSSFAKIQVEENYITKRNAKDGARQLAPGLKGKVYDYHIQSTSQTVSKKRSLPSAPLGEAMSCSSECVNEELQSLEQVNEELQSLEQVNKELQSLEHVSEELQSTVTPEPETQSQQPTVAMQDPITSPIVPSPVGSLEIATKPPAPTRSFSRKNSVLQIAENPQLQLPMDGFGPPVPASTPPASPRLELVAGANFFQMSPPAPDTLLDLGNCYEVLCMAKAEKLSHLQEAAYKVMSDNYLQVLRTPSIYSRLNARERELILQRRMKGKMCVTVADISTQEPDLHASRLCYYDDGGDRWHHLCHMPPEAVSQGCAMCSMFNYLFVVAGCEGSGRTQRPSNRVFCYNPLTNIWREICPLNQARPHCKLVALDGCLYAIGGECLHTVERYDPRQDRWTFTAPLPRDTFAVAHTATVCDGEIYVTGGTLRYVLLRYAARRDCWIVSPAGGSKDRTAEMVSTNGFIYRFDLNRSMGIGVYRCGAKAKLWYECATYAMPYPSCFQCAAVGGLVHCIGRRFHLRFLADHISPRFGTKELQPFPSPRGSLLPAVLVLPQGGTEQVQV